MFQYSQMLWFAVQTPRYSPRYDFEPSLCCGQLNGMMRNGPVRPRALNSYAGELDMLVQPYQRTHRMITSRSKWSSRNNCSMLFSSLNVGPQFSKSHCNRRVGAICTRAGVSTSDGRRLRNLQRAFW